MMSDTYASFKSLYLEHVLVALRNKTIFYKNKLPFKNTLLKTNWAESVSHAYLFTRERESFFVEREKMKSEIVRLKEHKKKAPKKV